MVEVMHRMSAEEIVKKDRDTLYIGNLNTVEFDLNLPVKGTYGSDITWESGHERFLTTEGKITRPTYGMGDRLVNLCATFRFEDVAATKTYEVTILQEANKLKVSKIYPVKKVVEVGKDAYLSQAAVVCTEDGDTIAHPVEWENDGYICYQETGTYKKEGKLTGTSYKVIGEIQVVKEQTEEIAERKPLLENCTEAVVRLMPGSPFYEAQEKMKVFLLSVDDDQMLYNFRYASGLDTKGAPVMEGWDAPESQLRGHTTGHYMSALALCYRATGDEKIKEKALYMIDSMEKCQEAFEMIPGIQSGFLSGYSEEQFDLLEKYTVYPIIWAPYYTLHKLFAGFLDCCQILESEKALDIAVKLGMWTWNRLSKLPKTQLSKMWSMYIAGEFGGMNEVMAKLYEITGKEEFIKCAKLFDNDKLFYPLEQGIDAISTMHANQHIPQIIGALEIFKATGEKKYYDIAKRFWEFITESRIYVTGGTGEGEMFHERNHIGGLLNENTQESCASYNMIKLTKELFRYEPDSKYTDYCERTLTNHILATLDEKISGESTYFLPLGPGMKREFLHENSCCHGTGLESHFKYGENIISHCGDILYINLYIPSSIRWEKKEIFVEIHEDFVAVKGKVKKVRFRKPYWCDSYNIWMKNGETKSLTEEKGYVEISGDFLNGEEICYKFEGGFKIHVTPDDASKAAISCGPYVLAALSEQKEFLKLSVEEKELKECMICEKDQFYRWEDITWVPLYLVGDQKYHTYIELES